MSLKLIGCFFILYLIIPQFAHSKTWTWGLDSLENHEMELQLDPYYSALDYIASLSDKPILKFDNRDEWGLYSHMFWHALEPRFMLIEASINPMPLTGSLVKSQSPGYYKNNESWLAPISTGFPEPWAMSLFFGNIGNLIDMDSRKDSVPAKTTGKAYSGYLVTYGNKHILNNQIIDDDWFELEVNMKGSAIAERHELAMSYRGGYKIHLNPNIESLLYFGLKRSSIYKDYRGWSLFKNTEFEALGYAEPKRLFRFWRYWANTGNSYRLILGKNWPLGHDGNYIFSLSLGLERTLGTGYTGILEQKIEKEWKMILRPNIKF